MSLPQLISWSSFEGHFDPVLQTSEQDSRRQDPEVGFVASSEDHHSAIDNPVADLGDIMPQGARRNSRDSSSDSSGSMGEFLKLCLGSFSSSLFFLLI